jgi:xyloglucan-specific exo-beta-1,4-glucanase
MRISARSNHFLLVLGVGLVGGCGAGAPAPATPVGGAPARGAAAAVEAGPPTSAAGTPYVWKNVTILGGGFVTGIEFSPVAAGVIYARTDVGGAYRWDPSAKVWIPLTDHFERKSNYLGIESLVADPVDDQKVYAAVGTYTAAWAGNGAILRSKDRGTTWELTDMPFKMGGNEDGRANGERLAVDPNQPNILYFGSRKNGLWRSEDAAVSWKKVETFPSKLDPKGTGIPFVVFDAKKGAKGKPTPVIYAGVSSTEVGLYQSTDAGVSWKPVPRQPAKLMPHHAAFDSNGILYVTYGDLPGPSDVKDGAVYKLDSKSGAWTNITPVAPSRDDSDKFGYAGLAVDARHPGTLLVTTIDRWTKGDETFRSTDGGKTWKPMFAKAEWDIAGAQYLYWHREKLGPPHWIGDIDLDPFDSNHAMFITGAGLWRTLDATQVDTGKPVHFRFSAQGLEETVVGVLASPPSGPPLYSGMGDICGFRHDDLDQAPKGGMYSAPTCSWTTGLDFAELSPNLMVRVGTVWGEGKHGAHSTDAGVTWKAFENEPANGKTGGGVALTADGKVIVWVIKKEAPVFSEDSGRTWRKIEGLPVPVDAPDWVPVNLRVAADRVNPKKVYVYDSAEGRLFASTDGGKRFTATASNVSGLPDYARSSGSIRTVPGLEGHVWLSTGKAVFRSTDSAVTFEEVTSTKESHAIGFGKAGPGRSYPAIYLIGVVGEVYGFFRSDDVGATWVRINDDQHQFGFSGAIAGDPRVFGRVYVGTGGRGILYGMPR